MSPSYEYTPPELSEQPEEIGRPQTVDDVRDQTQVDALRQEVHDADSLMKYLQAMYPNSRFDVREVPSLDAREETDSPITLGNHVFNQSDKETKVGKIGNQVEGEENARVLRASKHCLVLWKNDPENPVNWSKVAQAI